ncbi:MAG TPA: GNAT family N-acetyltransferase [Galbitalea sp.]|nr:GNAT family N-acetyltransferase [Galbitalea sp.]
MRVIFTDRLALVPLSHELMRWRMRRDDFRLHVPGLGLVTFPPTWPGDALAMFPSFLSSRGDSVPDSYVAINRGEFVAVGQLGATGDVGEGGAIEIGYGFGMPGRGYATEAVAALVAHLLARTSISTVTASTAVDNVASQRVLEKNGFRQVGTGWSEGDGDLKLWSRGSVVE